ncbi:protein of unknown function [Magnetospirillum gryphiswaldense MSR-1 v2]|uniref:Uncharacterized protein n=1 Tax=Magnetospirillum gryphiswaldense (strain DSM 6361 / JCM 21280 / NBRC 15271 / MSR-1) TaxID=431944 RepID=V6F5J7_MAGGM|nr:protein of unknown function [Magnetospirillum gryphiswaldense MSR-1 v2]
MTAQIKKFIVPPMVKLMFDS